MYAEFLARSFQSPKSIRNYIAGVRLLHKYLDVRASALYCFELHLMLRAMDITLDHIPNQRLPVTAVMLKDICQICESMGQLGRVIKFAILLGFYGMLRQSNLAPPTPGSFDPSRHTCRGDVFLHPPGLVILIKWSKCKQRRDAQHMVPIAQMPGHMLCPKQAYLDMLQAAPNRDPNSPLLQIPDKSHAAVPVPYLRTCFTAIIDYLGYNPTQYSLHSLRRGGATLAFQAGVSYIHIKRHGGWSSDAFWEYITAEPKANSPVSKGLAQYVSHHV